MRKGLIVILTLASGLTLLLFVNSWTLSPIPREYEWILGPSPSPIKRPRIKPRIYGLVLQGSCDLSYTYYVPPGSPMISINLQPLPGHGYTHFVRDDSGIKEWINRRRLWFRLEPLVIIFGTYPLISFVRGPLRRYRRRKKGLCIHCGYNLRGNTSGVCPECGKKIVITAIS